MMAPDIVAARAFLQRFDPEAEYFTFQTFDDSKEKRLALARIVHANPAKGALDSLAGFNDQGAGVFYAFNATDGKGRQAHNIERVRAVLVDLDGAPLAPVLAAKLEPHIVMESSPGKWHAIGWWTIARLIISSVCNARWRGNSTAIPVCTTCRACCSPRPPRRGEALLGGGGHRLSAPHQRRPVTDDGRRAQSTTSARGYGGAQLELAIRKTKHPKVPLVVYLSNRLARRPRPEQ